MDRTRTGLRALLAGILATAALLPATPAQAYHREKARLSAELRDTKSRLSKVMDSDEEISKILDEVNEKLRRQQRRLDAARAEVAQVDHRIATTQQRLTQLEADRLDRIDTVNDRAAALYMMGPMDPLTAVATSKNLHDFVARAAAVDFVAAFDRQILEDLAAIRYETRIGRITLREARAQAQERRGEVYARLSEIAAWQSAKQEAHNRLQNRIDRYRDMIRALEAEQERIENIIAGRGTYSGSVYTGSAGALGFGWPIRGMITSPYGPRWGGFHTGMDIDCDTGERIGASRAGRVIASEYAGGYGNMVIIDHGDGFSTLYAHNSRLLVNRGDRVERGSVISLCGSTGNSTGDHSHFEIRYNGQHRNPRPYLS